MDHVSSAFYALQFRLAFLEKKGVGFQDWVAKLGNHALGADFESVRPYGKQGDWKCDGRQVSTGTIFQCYGPETPTEQKTITKINADFEGALAKWPKFMRKWVFVHNTSSVQPPAVVAHLDKLRKKHATISLEIWSEAELYDWHRMLDGERALLMYGPVPDKHIASGLELRDLQPVISALEQHEPDPGDPSLSPPSVEKLEKNALSTYSAHLLRMGRLKVRLVETYFRKVGHVEDGEKIAEAFRNRYDNLKAMQLEPDLIFSNLQKFAGATEDPRRQAAAMAIMAYFFDRCDIFEDPGTEAPGT